MIIETLLPLFEFTHWVKALLHVYTYMEVGGRAAQEQLPSHPVCSPGYVKKLTKGATISSFFHYASQTNTTAWTQDDSREGGGSERLEHVLEVERIQETESRMTLHAVFTMDGVYAGFAWSKNLPNCGF